MSMDKEPDAEAPNSSDPPPNTTASDPPPNTELSRSATKAPSDLPPNT
jgi:hypothetical protein